MQIIWAGQKGKCFDGKTKIISVYMNLKTAREIVIELPKKNEAKSKIKRGVKKIVLRYYEGKMQK